LLARGSHRSGLARLTHPALRRRDLLSFSSFQLKLTRLSRRQRSDAFSTGSTIRASFVEMLWSTGSLASFPRSSHSAGRPFPPRVLVRRVPRFLGTTGVSDFSPPIPRRFVLLRSAVLGVRTVFVFLAAPACTYATRAGLGFSVRVSVPRVHQESARSPRFL
jgi:hypothetical protein